MATTVFTAHNVAPELNHQDQNWTINGYMCKKSLGNDIDSVDGWTAPGPLEGGSYQSPLETGTNKTMLGAVKVPKSLHYNSQAMTLQFKTYGITPFGNRVKNKNRIAPVIGYKSGAATTVAADGGATTEIVLTSGTNFSVGMMVEIVMPSGEPEYRRIEAKATNTITLDYPLMVAPADGANVKGVQYIDYKPGGSGPEKYSGLFVGSGDFDDRLLHYYQDLRVSQGNNEMPDGNVGMTSFSLEVFPKSETINGRVEPVFLLERLQFEDLA